MSRILITGGSGYLGRTLAALLAGRHDVFAGYCASSPPEHGKPLNFDLRRPDDIQRALDASQPECVIHTAALTKPDYCELHSAETHAVNVEATRQIAMRCSQRGSKLIHISTDLVFDGVKGHYKESDPAIGISVYARSKIAAESAVLEEDPGAVILRVSVMYGPGNSIRPGFLEDIVSRWHRGETIAFFTDQFRTPTYTPQIADAIQRFLGRQDLSGIFHLGSADRVSRYDFASLLAQLIDAPPALLERGSVKEYRGPAKRGADCSLVSEKIQQALGLQPMTCFTGLSNLLETGHLKKLQETGP